MSYTTFTTATAGTAPPDPHKHVKYTQGMVLGVDDFTQEFAYLSNRDQWLARDAIGYGTVSGLHVSRAAKDGDIQVAVSAGVAITPRGQLVRVIREQCALLGVWLQLPATQQRLVGIGPNAGFTAYVVLCYRDCPTDNLPVPGEPCRCDSETMAPSRITDDFRLELTLTPPPQLEEGTIRHLIEWLRAVEVADFYPGQDELEAFLQAIRDKFGEITSPLDSSVGSPPAGLRIPRDLACEWMRAAMRLWVTELRPHWQAQCGPQSSCGCTGPCGCHGIGAEPSNQACDCVLLAEIEIRRQGGVVTEATLKDENRPFLVHLRMLQELLLCGPCICGGERGELGSPPDVGPVPVPDDSVLVAEDAFSRGRSAPNPGVSPGFARADHTHGLPPDPIPPHISRINDHVNHQIAGDVSGTLGASTVMRLRGVQVNPPVTTEGNILVVRNGRLNWEAPSSGIQGEFVEHAPGVGRYFIIAAGDVNLRGQSFPVQPNYHNLRVRPQRNGFLLTYGTAGTGDPIKGYVEPGQHTYMVKGTSFGELPAFLHVDAFTRTGIRIRFAGNPRNQPPERVVIEISLFGLR